MSKLKLETHVTERFDVEAKVIAPVIEAQANQVVGVLGKELIGQDFKPNLSLGGIHHYTRSDSYVFWQKVGNFYNDFVKQKPWLSTLFITPIGEEKKALIADRMANYIGGNALVIGTLALAGMGFEGRTMRSVVNSETLAPYMDQMNQAMDAFHMGWFGNSAAAGLVAFGLIGVKMGWDAIKHMDHSRFVENRNQAILDGALEKEKTFMQRFKSLLNAKYFTEPEVGKKSLNRLQTMQHLNFSTEKMMEMTKRTDEPTFKHIERTAKLLVKKYLVEPHASTQMAIGMIVEMKGDTNHLTAILNSRHLLAGWADKHGIDPKTVVKEEAGVALKQDPLQIEHQRQANHGSQPSLAM